LAAAKIQPTIFVSDGLYHQRSRGLFANVEFRPGEIVCVKGGHIFKRAMLEKVSPILGRAEIQIADDPMFERRGDDLYTDAPIDLYIAVLGGEAQVPTLKGKVALKIPPETQAGKTFRLGGQGMPKVDNPKAFGDLYARVRVVLPERLSDAERELFEKLAAMRNKK